MLGAVWPLAARPPEEQVLTSAQHGLVMYAVVVAGFALFAAFLHAWHGASEVSARYRPAVLAHLCLTAVATVSYGLVLVKLEQGYEVADGRYVPNPEALFAMSSRYLDWSVTVPLLMVELLAVTTLAGRRLSAARTISMAAAFLMILTGYLGAQVFEEGGSSFWLWLWWAVSCGFFVVLYVVLVPAVVRSVRELPRDAGRALAMAATVLLATFLVYPVVYLIPVFAEGGWWTTTMHLAFSAADVVAKVGFGILIHKVAKLRTAADVAAGEDTHPEPVWIDQVHHSDGVLPAPRGPAGLEHEPDAG